MQLRETLEGGETGPCDGGWALWDGRRAGHALPLLAPLRRSDAVLLAPAARSLKLVRGTR